MKARLAGATGDLHRCHVKTKKKNANQKSGDVTGVDGVEKAGPSVALGDDGPYEGLVVIAEIHDLLEETFCKTELESYRGIQ